MPITTTTYTPWDGFQGGFDGVNNTFFLTIQDAKETNYPYLNSVSSSFNNINSYVNIDDGSYHYIMFGWNMTGAVAYKRGILGVDNIVFRPTVFNDVSGKSTPLHFVFNDLGQETNWAFGGYYSTADSATSKTNAQSIKNFNGDIQNIIIWDTLLTLTANGNIVTNPGGQWQAATNGVNPFTDSTLGAASSHIIFYTNFQNDIVGGTTALDRAGSSVSGVQTNPSTGNTVYLYHTVLPGFFNYILYDVNNNSSTIYFPNGIIQFVDENGVSHNVGTIFYEFGIIILDNEYVKTGSTQSSLSGLPLLSSLSVSSMGFNVLSNTGLNVNYISFNNQTLTQRLIASTFADSDDFNHTQNTTGIIAKTGQQLLNQNQGTYVSCVGLYNSLNDLIAVAKLNNPIRKDSDHTITVNVNLDF